MNLATTEGDRGTTTGLIVVDERHVYVDTNRGLFRAPKCGGPSVRLAENSPGQYSATGLVQDARYLYLAASAPLKGGFVRRIAKDGSSMDELAATSGELFGLALAKSGIDGRDRLYWVEKASIGGTLRARTIDDGRTETLATVPMAYSYGPFAADTSGVTFFAMGSSNYGTFYTHRWEGLTSTGTGATPYAIAANPTSGMFFSFGHTGVNGIARLPTNVRIAEAKAPCGLAVLASALYWTDMSAGTVNRCSISSDGCNESTALATGEDDPRYLAVDELAVYWATRRGTIKRVSR